MTAPRIIVSLHDVAPATATASARWLEVVERQQMVATLLVVPGPWRGSSIDTRPELGGWLRAATTRGHEVGLHGWEHRAVGPPSLSARHCYGRLLGRGCAEFWELDEPTAARRLRDGLERMARHGLAPRGFTPPAWLASPGTAVAAKSAGLEYTTTQWSIVDLRGDHRYRCFAISQRPGSPLTSVADRAARAIAVQRIDARRMLRLALHPADLAHPEIVRTTVQLLRRASDEGYRAVTYLEALETLRLEPSAT